VTGTFRGTTFPLLLTIMISVVLTGCDGGGSKQASQSQRLSGTWELEVLSAGGFRAFPNARLVVSAGEGRRKFRLIRETQNDTTEARGELELVGEARLAMTGAFFPGTLLWNIDFSKPDDISGSFRLTLVGITQQESIRAFLRFLGVPETAQDVQMDFVLAS
jgi:hypothetical protein